MLEMLSLEDIRTEGMQPRARLVQAVVDEYGERMMAGEKFPPISVRFDGRSYWLWDGFHRLQAIKDRGMANEIECDVTEGSKVGARWASFKANRNHGLQMDVESKQKVVEGALTDRPDLSDRAIAEHCGVGHPMVAKARKRLFGEVEKGDEPTPRIDRNGRRMNTTPINNGRPKKAKAPLPVEKPEPPTEAPFVSCAVAEAHTDQTPISTPEAILGAALAAPGHVCPNCGHVYSG